MLYVCVRCLYEIELVVSINYMDSYLRIAQERCMHFPRNGMYRCRCRTCGSAGDLPRGRRSHVRSIMCGDEFRSAATFPQRDRARLPL